MVERKTKKKIEEGRRVGSEEADEEMKKRGRKEDEE